MTQTIWKIADAQTETSQVYPAAAGGKQSEHPNLSAIAAGYAPITLKQAQAVALMNRIDTKYIISTDQLLAALQSLQPDYWMLSVNEQRLNRYRTLYFDSPDFELYRLHVTGHAERYKVRSREYTDSHLSFLEVKHKNRKGRTIKDRVSTATPLLQINPEVDSWLKHVFPYDSFTLEPKLWNRFTRMTLVSRQLSERVTLDIDLAFFSRDEVIPLYGIAIAEVKMDTSSTGSRFQAQMRAQKIHPQGFSKYCIGVSLLYSQVKRNRMKPKMLWIEKMTGNVSHE